MPNREGQSPDFRSSDAKDEKEENKAYANIIEIREAIEDAVYKTHEYSPSLIALEKEQAFNFLLHGYSQDFKECLEERIQLWDNRKNIDSRIIEHSRKFLDQAYVEESIKNLQAAPSDWFKKIEDANELKYDSNNFPAMFNGWSAKHLNLPSFIRFIYKYPDLAAEISKPITYYYGFRFGCSIEAMELKKSVSHREYINKKDSLMETFPYDKLLEAYNHLVKLVDVRDFDDNSPEKYKTMEELYDQNERRRGSISYIFFR